MNIRIVSHCYAVAKEQYACFLRYQLSSLLLYPPKQIHPIVTICYTDEDERTIDVLRWFICNSSLQIEPLEMDPGSLFQRSIGRNLAALRSREDLVWFTDVDFLFRKGCLDGLAELWSPQDQDVVMCYPRRIWFQSEATNELHLEFKTQPQTLLDVASEKFHYRTFDRAVGPIQIVRGEVAREYGYLNDFEKFQKPRDDGKPFPSFHDDVRFRKVTGSRGRVVQLDFPGLCRLRHPRVRSGIDAPLSGRFGGLYDK